MVWGLGMCRGWGAVKKEFAESSIDESVWRLVSEALLFQPELRLRWLHWVLLPPCGVSQVTPHPPIRAAGTPARAAICKLLLSFLLVHSDCPMFASSSSHRPGCYFQGRPIVFVLILLYHCVHVLFDCIHRCFECLPFNSFCMTVFFLWLRVFDIVSVRIRIQMNNYQSFTNHSLVTEHNETWPAWLLQNEIFYFKGEQMIFVPYLAPEKLF